MLRSLIQYFKDKRLRGEKIDWAKCKAPDMTKSLESSDNADQYFVQPSKGRWINTWRGVQLAPEIKNDERSMISGVRLNASDDFDGAKQTQYDLGHCVAGLNSLRAQTEFSNLVLSNQSVISRLLSGSQYKSRVQFSLLVPRGKSMRSSSKASDSCFKNIKSGIARGGFRIVSPKKFDPQTGMLGLEEWAWKVQLRRKRRWPWLLLLLPLLLLLKDCSCREPGSIDLPPIRTEGYLLILDISSSMDPVIEIARNHMQSLITAHRSNAYRRKFKYMNVISYNNQAQSALGELKRVNQDVLDELARYVSNLNSSGGTDFATALQQAAVEVNRLSRPTTIHIITDAEDGSVSRMLLDVEGLKRDFGGHDVVMFATSPRALGENPGAGRSPQTSGEMELNKLLLHFDGRFGTQEN